MSIFVICDWEPECGDLNLFFLSVASFETRLRGSYIAEEEQSPHKREDTNPISSILANTSVRIRNQSQKVGRHTKRYPPPEYADKPRMTIAKTS
jgi:hypothetical protein